MTNYSFYYYEGRKDREAGKTMDNHPDSITMTHAFRGYVDGWSGREFKEPVPAMITHKPRRTEN